MSDARDVIVIGAGIIGCAVARELARRGARVRVIEARTIGAGATQASAGMLVPYIEGHERGPFFDVALRSFGLYDGFVADLSRESNLGIEYRKCGSLQVAPDDAAAGTLHAAQDRHQRAGDNLQWLEPEALRRAEPGLPDTMAGAILVPAHAYVSVPQLTDALAWAAVRHGVEIETGRHVTGIGRDRNHLTVATDDGAAWPAGAVVIAAGSWSGQLGLGELAAGDVRPVRGQLLRLAWRGTPLSHIVWGPDCYVVPWLDGTVLVGATMEDVGFDERTTAAGVRDLLDAVCELVPEAWGATFLEARAGLRPATTDGLPIIGASAGTPGLFYATGHYRNGILLTPLTAQLVADAVLDGISDPALALVAPGRIPPPGRSRS